MSLYWLDKDSLFPEVTKKLQKVDIVLDIGCGIRPQNYIIPLVHICCEPFEEYSEILLEQANQQTDRRFIILKAGWEEAVKLFSPKSVDTIFLLDIIEHLEKEKGEELLRLTESIARKQVVIFTPLGYVPQEHPDGIDAWGLNGGAWQEHKSGWLPEDFDDSWDTYACKEFHFTDHNGKLFDKPYGAFWAIKTLEDHENQVVRIGVLINSHVSCESEERWINKLQEKISSIHNQFTNNSIQIFIILLCDFRLLSGDEDEKTYSNVSSLSIRNFIDKLKNKYNLNIDEILVKDMKEEKHNFNYIKDYAKHNKLGIDAFVFSDMSHSFIQSETLFNIGKRYQQGYNFIITRIYMTINGFQNFDQRVIKPVFAISCSLLKKDNVFHLSSSDSIFQDELEYFFNQAYSGYLHSQVNPLYDTNLLVICEEDTVFKECLDETDSIGLSTQWIRKTNNFFQLKESFVQNLTLNEYINYSDMTDVQRFILGIKVWIRRGFNKIARTATRLLK